MNNNQDLLPTVVLHWNYRGFTEFPLHRIHGEESEITDIYLKDNLISRVPNEICKLENLESLYLTGNDITELPKEISQLRCLKCLEISGNRLRWLPDEIGDLTSLKFLILDENELTALPLRLSELRSLRYLSVCDNKLQWLPQRPVYNYHHCEFRFWRNIDLKVLPYSLWYHMFRDQQTRSLNIGCLSIPLTQTTVKNGTCRLKLNQGSRQWDVDIICPPQHNIVLDKSNRTPPSLYELCKRQLYQIICDTAKRQSDNVDLFCIGQDFYNNNGVKNLQESLNEIDIDRDINYNNNENNNTPIKEEENIICKHRRKTKSFYVSSDVIDEHLEYLPHFLKNELYNGPVSKCENILCKRPVFNYAYYEFCYGKLILIDNVQDIILSAAFCSKACSDIWKTGKCLIPWTLV